MKQVFLRHKHGNGKIYGNSASVTADTYLDRASSVADDSEVYESRVIRSAVIDRAVIHQATIEDSLISDDTRILGPARVTNSTLSGQCRLWDSPVIENCTLRNVFVFDTAILSGFQLDAFVRIHSGRWERAPRYHVICGEGIEVTISECTRDRFHIGCFCLPWVTWTRPGYRQMIGKRSGWTPEMVEFCYETFKGWR